MTIPGPLALRPLTPRDLPQAHALSQSVRWPHRLEDWQVTLPLGQGWAAVDAADALVGVALWWAFGDDLATLGTVIVSPDLQRSGIGRRLLDAILTAAGPRRIRLNATAEGRRLYESFGFVDVGGIRQHQGVLSAEAAPTPAPAGVDIVSLDAAHGPALLALDRQASDGDRAAMLAALRELSTGRVALRGGDLVGYALCRDFGRGRLVGPIVAGDEATALALASDLAVATGGFVRVDIPDDAAAMSRWLEGAGMVGVDRVRAMLRGALPARHPDARIYGLASQALG